VLCILQSVNCPLSLFGELCCVVCSMDDLGFESQKGREVSLFFRISRLLFF